MSITATLEAVHSVGVRLAEAGFTSAAEGGLSARAGDYIVIGPAAAAQRARVAADLSVVDLASGKWTGPQPPHDLDLHLAIYHRRKEIGAILRCSPDYASTMAAARRCVPPVLEEFAQVVGPSARVVELASSSAAESARAVQKGLRGRMAALLAEHGAVCLGRHLEEAFLCCQVLERACRTVVEAVLLGGARHLGFFTANIFHQYYLRRYSKIWERQRA
jgi:L-fuculose-phosphate aldolase